MHPLNCLLVDDEPAALDILTHYVHQTPFLKLAGRCLGPIEALQKVYSEPIDLIFLDIHMPELSGLDFIKVLNGRAKVILTTAYSQYALEGYEYNVVDYLLKPVAFDRFLKAAQKALDQRSPVTPPSPTVPLQPAEEDYIFVKADNRTQRITLSDIQYVEGLGNYVSIYTDQGRVVTLLTMKEVEERLPERRFMRIHRSYLIALDRLQYIEGNEVFLDKKTAIPLGETYREKFFKALESKTLNKR